MPDTNDKKQEVKRLEALVQDKDHLRRAALWEAGRLLRGAEEEVLERLIEKIDEDILQEGGRLYEAYEALAQAIARQVVSIGDELIAQYRTLKEQRKSKGDVSFS